MGDRTSVILTVLATQAEQAKQYMDYQANTTGSSDTGLCTYFYFEEVNYGSLGFLDVLQAAGIAYISEWGDGSEYGSGAVSCRFTAEGEVVIKEIYDSAINPDIGNLLELIDQPDALRAYILHHRELRTVLPWGNQEEYGKIYRAKQLIENPS